MALYMSLRTDMTTKALLGWMVLALVLGMAVGAWSR